MIVLLKQERCEKLEPSAGVYGLGDISGCGATVGLLKRTAGIVCPQLSTPQLSDFFPSSSYLPGVRERRYLASPA